MCFDCCPIKGEELAGYKITPKGMVLIYLIQDIPHEVLKQIVMETLE